MRAGSVLARGSWDAAPTDSVTLDYDRRFRRRLTLTTDSGLSLLLDLAEARELRDGDGLYLDDGRIVAVRAAPEPVADILCSDAGQLVRIAWHLGNRHLPTQVLEDRLRIRQDHVIEEMARGLGATVERRHATFDPEGGAYARGQAHRHGHSHSHDHDHSPPDDQSQADHHDAE